MSVHEPGQAPETNAMRRYGGGQRAPVQNVPLQMHITPHTYISFKAQTLEFKRRSTCHT